MDVPNTCIFLNGDFDIDKSIVEYPPAGGFNIAVDGGVRHLKALNMIPDVLIGDLDSVSAQDLAWCKRLQVVIHQYPKEKDQTDFELAIDYAMENRKGKIIVFGALGGRIDHTLANIGLLCNPEYAGMDIRIFSNNEYIYFLRSPTTIKGNIGDIISLIPWGEPVLGVTTTGLKFPLCNEDLLPDRSRGISNVICSSDAIIEFKKGNLLCVQQYLLS
jgi:thiamine pyrophosphokinase